MYTNSFSVIEIEGGAGFTDQAITIILEPFRIRILVSFSTIILANLNVVGSILSLFKNFYIIENEVKRIKIHHVR